MQTSDTHSKLLPNGRVSYLDCQAPVFDGSGEGFQDDLEIDLNNSKDEVARWRAAILSLEEGWEVIVSRNG
jgi:hypothetical protein